MSGTYLLVFYVFLVPVIIFVVKPDAPHWLKSGRLIAAILSNYLLHIISGYAQIEADNLFWEDRHGCWPWDIFTFISITSMWLPYVGLWEGLWRGLYRQWSKKIKENFQYGFISNLTIAFSIYHVLIWALTAAGCPYCGMASLPGIFAAIWSFTSPFINLQC